MKLDDIIQGDALEVLKGMSSDSIDCCVTSPPYWGLRDYGCEGQIGLESSPEAYVSRLVAVFGEVKRCLKKEGTLWLNLGDSYAGGKGQSGQFNPEAQQVRHERGESLNAAHHQVGGKKQTRPTDDLRMLREANLKPKDLLGIPWRVAFALQADGYYLRSDIIWSKPNPMPESVTDRPTKAHEYVFLLAKNSKYYCDMEAIKEPSIDEECYTGRRPRNKTAAEKSDPIHTGYRTGLSSKSTGKLYPTKNKRTVWEIVATKSCAESHFATYPEELIEPCIKAGCPQDGIVLDPFMGSGTTGAVALRLKRHYVGIELNPAYIKLANKRIYSGCKQLSSFMGADA